MYKIPALDTVAGVAVLRWLISNNSLIEGVNGILSLLASVKICEDIEFLQDINVHNFMETICNQTLLSSITVLSDSIHMGSMSPSKTIHFGPSYVWYARSRITTENNPN